MIRCKTGLRRHLISSCSCRPEKWVRLPDSWYASFKTGAYRGITLHANGSTDMQYYGYMEGETIKWRWHYRK